MKKKKYVKPEIEDIFVAKGLGGDLCASGTSALVDCSPGTQVAV